MCVFDDLVDQAKPGDRVEVTAVYRAVPIRMSSTRRTLKSVYKTYLDIITREKGRGRLDEEHRTEPRTTRRRNTPGGAIVEDNGEQSKSASN